MEIVVPHSVEIIATFTARSNQFGFLALIFCEQKNRTRTSRFARGAANSPDDVFIRVVKDALRRVEAESIEMKLLDPVASISDEKFADRSCVWSIEIDRVSPIVFLLASQVIVGINAEIISIRAEVIIDNVENDTQA